MESSQARWMAYKIPSRAESRRPIRRTPRTSQIGQQKIAQRLETKVPADIFALNASLCEPCGIVSQQSEHGVSERRGLRMYRQFGRQLRYALDTERRCDDRNAKPHRLDHFAFHPRPITQRRNRDAGLRIIYGELFVSHKASYGDGRIYSQVSYFGRGIGANQPETDMRCALPNYREDLLEKPKRHVLIWIMGKAGNKQDITALWQVSVFRRRECPKAEQRNSTGQAMGRGSFYVCRLLIGWLTSG